MGINRTDLTLHYQMHELAKVGAGTDWTGLDVMMKQDCNARFFLFSSDGFLKGFVWTHSVFICSCVLMAWLARELVAS
jgi:hypothetical protein